MKPLWDAALAAQSCDPLPVGNHAYKAVCRHYQFFDIHNGAWYVEVLPTAEMFRFIVQEVRNGAIVRRSREPTTFAEARRVFWDRSHRMSIEAGFESAPPPMPKIEFAR